MPITVWKLTICISAASDARIFSYKPKAKREVGGRLGFKISFLIFVRNRLAPSGASGLSCGRVTGYNRRMAVQARMGL
jgi:hypothetical protein